MYYGWKIVAALFVILTFCSGLGFYNHAVTLQALVSEISLPPFPFSFSLAAGRLMIAALLDRHDVRLVITGGAILAFVSTGHPVYAV